MKEIFHLRQGSSIFLAAIFGAISTAALVWYTMYEAREQFNRKIK